MFSGIFAYGRWALNLSTGGEARNVNGNFVSGQFFDTLGVHAALGRTLTVADDQHGCPAVELLSYGFWQREYGGRGDIVGKTISIDNHPVPIVGVTQAGFTSVVVGWEADVFAPLCAGKILYGEIILLERNTMPGWLLVIGRPKPGITPAQATARLKTLAPGIFKASFQPGQPGQAGYLERSFDTAPAANGSFSLRTRYGGAIIVLMAVVGLVLLIACANLATLLLACGAGIGVLLARWGTHHFAEYFRAFLDGALALLLATIGLYGVMSYNVARRRNEIGIRTALGAEQARVMRIVLGEVALLIGVGLLVGLCAALATTRLVAGFLYGLSPNDPVIFAVAAAVLAGVAFTAGFLPARRASHVDPMTALREE